MNMQATSGRSTISPVTSPADRKAFLELPYRAYQHLPSWRAPLRFERATQINPAKNPGLAMLQHQFFLARKGDQVVGRIAAFINPAHLERHRDATGHFGFIDTLSNDPEVLASLTDAAAAWLKARGMQRMAGPFNFSVNEECGLLVDGFETPPMVMMLHGRPDYAGSMEAAGFHKAMDVYAFLHEFAETYTIPPKLQKLKAAFERDSRLSIRPMNMKEFKTDVALIMDIFNDAWSQNWGFVPFSPEQINVMSDELKPLMTSDGMWVAMVDGEPAGFTLFLPDLNELTMGLNGNLLPFGWAKLIWGLKVRGATRSRLPLAGLRHKFQKTKRGALAMAGAFEAAFAAQHKRGIRQIEASWVLETNHDLIGLTQLYDMRRYKTYRLYEKAI